MGITKRFWVKTFKAKIRGIFNSLTGYTVAMVTYYVEKTTITCSPMFTHLFGTIIAC